jgi:hypothetical protein
MLSTLQVVIYSFVIFLGAVAIYSLFNGSKAPPNSWLTKYYEAEKYLGPVGNVMLIALAASSAFKLALHFGFVSPTDPDGAELIAGTPFIMLMGVYWLMWFRAWRKVKSTANGATHS